MCLVCSVCLKHQSHLASTISKCIRSKCTSCPRHACLLPENPPPQKKTNKKKKKQNKKKSRTKTKTKNITEKERKEAGSLLPPFVCPPERCGGILQVIQRAQAMWKGKKETTALLDRTTFVPGSFFDAGANLMPTPVSPVPLHR